MLSGAYCADPGMYHMLGKFWVNGKMHSLPNVTIMTRHGPQ